MADITKCRNESCKIKENCYRYTALPGQLQSYFADWGKGVKVAADCKFFWNNEK